MRITHTDAGVRPQEVEPGIAISQMDPVARQDHRPSMVWPPGGAVQKVPGTTSRSP